jgi:hypothetical protein
MVKKGGWFRESERHSLASRGVRTGTRAKPKTPRIKRASLAKPSGDITETLYGYLSKPYRKEDAKMLQRLRHQSFYFEGLPPQVALDLAKADPKLMGLDDAQNMSPELKEMIEIATKYGGTLEGYAIPRESGREDARISIDGFTLPLKELEALRLQIELRADEFGEDEGGYRYWWD